MEEIFVVCELKSSDTHECTGPIDVLRNRSAIESYFECWYENEPHICISETGRFYRLRFNDARGVIEPILDDATPPDKEAFSKLLTRYLDAIEHRKELRLAISDARSLLLQGTPDSMRKLRSMADVLGFI